MSNTPATIQQQVENYASAHELFVGADEIIVGFSGGADSTCLLHVLARLHPAVRAVHLHHDIRGADADDDASWCREFCQREGIEFTCVHLQVPQRQLPGESLEQTARRCRHEYWAELAEASASPAIALGHHADDRLEDLFLRLTRGSNASGLVGLRPRRRIGSVTYVRPLLFLRRAQIEAYLHGAAITDWQEDATNRDTTLRRNLVRHELLPLIRRTWGHDSGLFRSLEDLEYDADFLEQEARRQCDAVASFHDLRQLHPALLPRVLRIWLQDQLGRDYIPPASAVERLRQELNKKDRRERLITMGEGIILRVNADGLALTSAAGPNPFGPINWPWRYQPHLSLPENGLQIEAVIKQHVNEVNWSGTSANTEYFDPDTLPAELVVRSWSAGDRMVPFGHAGPEKLKNLFIDAGIPRHRRTALPVVLAGDTIIWVPGVRRAEFGRLTGNEQFVVELTCSREDDGTTGG